MVVLHGWNNFASMLTGWKKNPEYLAALFASPRDRGHLMLQLPNDAVEKPADTGEASRTLMPASEVGESLFAELVKPYERRVYMTALLSCETKRTPRM